MSLDLILRVPRFGRQMTGGLVGSDIVVEEPGSQLLDAIEALQQNGLPPGCYVYRYSDDGEPVEQDTLDQRGSPLMWVKAGELAAAFPGPDAWELNVAAGAYLRALPPEWPVILDWW